MNFVVQSIIAAVIGYIVPKVLDRILTKAKGLREQERGVSASFPWFLWCFAHALAGVIGGIISAGMGATPGGVGNWLVFGASIGLGQWLILRRYSPVSPFWALSSAFGWAVFSIFQALKTSGYLGWAVAGVAIGLFQYPMLRKRLTKAGWWVPANGLGWLAGGSLGFAVGITLLQAQVPLTLIWPIGWGVVGVTGGTIIGIAIANMPIKPETEELQT